MMRRTRLQRTGVTLIELMVVLSLIAVVVTLAAPSFTRMIEMQRLRGVHDQLITDMQFARSEAARLGVPVQIFVRDSIGADACYTIFSDARREQRFWQFPPCDCHYAAGQECKDAPTTTSALKVVRVPREHKVNLQVTSIGFGSSWRMEYDPVTGGMTPAGAGDSMSSLPDRFEVQTSLDTQRKLSAVVAYSGRPTSCAPTGSVIRLPRCTP